MQDDLQPHLPRRLKRPHCSGGPRHRQAGRPLFRTRHELVLARARGVDWERCAIGRFNAAISFALALRGVEKPSALRATCFPSVFGAAEDGSGFVRPNANCLRER